MDESIPPSCTGSMVSFLSQGISSIVVVGGVEIGWTYRMQWF
jgi:hypothetical protein